MMKTLVQRYNELPLTTIRYVSKIINNRSLQQIYMQ